MTLCVLNQKTEPPSLSEESVEEKRLLPSARPLDLTDFSEADRNRVTSRLDKSGGDEACWPWTGLRQPGGYGRICVRGRAERSHRVCYALFNGPIPAGIVVRHSCDNPPCGNPAHLILGTLKDNAVDMIERGRYPVGDRHWSRKNPESVRRGDGHHFKKDPSRAARGEQCGQSKLTNIDVIEIRRLHEIDGMNSREIAGRYGVTSATIGCVLRRHTWAHI